MLLRFEIFKACIKREGGKYEQVWRLQMGVQDALLRIDGGQGVPAAARAIVR